MTTAIFTPSTDEISLEIVSAIICNFGYRNLKRFMVEAVLKTKKNRSEHMKETLRHELGYINDAGLMTYLYVFSSSFHKLANQQFTDTQLSDPSTDFQAFLSSLR